MYKNKYIALTLALACFGASAEKGSLEVKAREVVQEDSGYYVLFDEDNKSHDEYDVLFDSSWYLGLGLGVSHVDPEGEAAGWYTPSWGDDSQGYKLFFGYHFSPHWSVELAYADLGEADLTNRFPSQLALVPENDRVIDYKVPSLMANYYWFEPNSDFNIYGKFGVAAISNSAGSPIIPFEEQTSVQFALGLGLQYRFNDTWFVRLEADSYDRDAIFASVQLGAYLGSNEYRYKPKPIPAPVNTLKPVQKPVVIDSDNDGVEDSMDKCPNTRIGAQVDKTGCEFFAGVLDGVNFKTNSAQLTSEAQSILNGVASTLLQFEGLRVLLTAHTDSMGDARYNLNLSSRRVISVRDYLSKKGVSMDRMEVKGEGETRPIADNNTAEGRSQNRRVEITPVN